MFKINPIPFFEDHERFLKFIRVDLETDCWNWTGNKHKGYGRFYKGKRGSGKQYPAHRVSCEIFKGGIKEGLVIDHLCKNKACVNPDHLRAVTNIENVTQNTDSHLMLNKVKTHCVRGHLFDDQNTYVHEGHRRCRECMRIRRAKNLKGRRRSACKWGHEYTEGSYTLKPDGSRRCKLCRRVSFSPSRIEVEIAQVSE